MASSASISSSDRDIEKDHPHHHVVPHINALSVVDKAVRSGQHILSTVALAVIAMALDRSLTSKKFFADEIFAVIVVSLGHIVLLFGLLSAHNKRTAMLKGLDGLCALLLTAATILSVVYQAKGIATCQGPAFIGVFDNLRACRKMTGATVLLALDAVMFAISAIRA